MNTLVATPNTGYQGTVNQNQGQRLPRGVTPPKHNKGTNNNYR